MSLATLEAVKNLCRQYDLRPSRKSGQNFLICEKVLMSIIKESKLAKQDSILEIGAGWGVLTVELASRVKNVVAVEMDKRLLLALNKLQTHYKSLKVIEGDIFKNWPNISKFFSDQEYKLIANLPYNITSLVIRNFIEKKPRPSAMVLMVQKEVAERMTARPGAMSVLSIAVQFYAEVDVVREVDRACFWPAPKVDSAVVKISSIGRPGKQYHELLSPLEPKDFFRVVKIGFSSKRKQLHNNLSAGMNLPSEVVKQFLGKISLNRAIRAQELSIEQWIQITKKFSI